MSLVDFPVFEDDVDGDLSPAGLGGVHREREGVTGHRTTRRILVGDLQKVG